LKFHFLARTTMFAVLLTFFLLPAAAHAANVAVGCPGGSGEHPRASARHWLHFPRTGPIPLP
jgi:hypothetical protein